MKQLMLTIIALSLVMAGCNETSLIKETNQPINSGLVKTYHNIAIKNAVIRQSTLYPYHFIVNSSELNELGRQDLTTLIEHFRQYAIGLSSL